MSWVPQKIMLDTIFQGGGHVPPLAHACGRPCLGWEIAAHGYDFPSWWREIRVQYARVYIAIAYMGVSNTFPTIGRVHYGMDPIGLRSGRVRTQDPGGNRHLCGWPWFGWWSTMVKHTVLPYSWTIPKQESCAIAKINAQCAPRIGALKVFGTLWLCPRLHFLNLFTGFCSDWPYECAYKI